MPTGEVVLPRFTDYTKPTISRRILVRRQVVGLGSMAARKSDTALHEDSSAIPVDSRKRTVMMEEAVEVQPYVGSPEYWANDECRNPNV